MNLRNFALLFTLLILVGCNQSDSDSKAPSADNAGTGGEHSQTGMNENAATAETEPEIEGTVVARVNGQPIYEAALTREDLEYAIAEEIIYQEGLRQGLNKRDRDRVRNYEKKLIIRGMKQRILENTEPEKGVSNEEIKSYYESNKDKYIHVRIHEISFPDSDVGNEIRDKAQGEEDLQTIANGYPDLEITVNDLGYNRNIAQNFKTREVGSVSEVIQKPDGTFSVLKIVEIKDIPFNVSKKSIKHLLEAKRKAREYNDYARKVAEENNMTIEIIEQEPEQ